MAIVDKSKVKNIGPGFQEYRMNSWGDLVDFLRDDMREYNSYVWRGQRDPTWTLEPTINRLSYNNNPIFVIENEVLKRFKAAVRGRRGPNPPQLLSDNDWWALGQHHGLATPLLDWTTSPFVAAFFAYLEPYPKGVISTNDLAEEMEKSKPKHRAIYALHTHSVEQWAKEDMAATYVSPLPNINGMPPPPIYIPPDIKPVIEFVRPMSDENQRLINQGGLFTRFYGNKTIEEWIPSRHPADQNGVSLMKILVPDDDRVKALTLLNRMNINPLSLFPDLIGASMYSNLHAEIPNY